MVNLLSYALFEDISGKVVSFDFDGVLHVSVEGINPVSFDDPTEWEPFTEIIELIHELAKTNTIVVLSARDSWNVKEIEEFIKMHKIPISEVYCTDGYSKRDVLVEIGAVRHYDDRLDMIRDLKGTGIEFVLVRPNSRDWKSMGKQ
jgi:hypothetical protein